MKPYTEEEKMHNYVEWAKNELDDAYIELSKARSNLHDIRKGPGAFSGAYAYNIAETIEAVQKLIESLKAQIEETVEYYVDEEYPIKEEEE